MKRSLAYLRKATAWFTALSGRERLLIGATLGAAIIYTGVVIVEYIQEQTEKNRVALLQRTRDLDELGQLLRRYKQLSLKLQKVEATFSQSEMTVDQVYSELDRIVRESIGTGKYDLKRSPASGTIGPNVEQQNFALRVSALSLEQFVSLLYKLEQGKTALFLGKVDLVRMPQAGTFSATLEVSSIRKRVA